MVTAFVTDSDHVRTARRYRTIEIQVGNKTINAAEPLPDDLRRALGQSTAIQVTD